MALKIHGTDNIQAGTVQTEVLAGGVGGGPKITGIAVTDSSYTNIDDTAVGLSGGYIKITGTGFSSGCQVVIGATVATAVVFVSSTEVRAQIPAQSAGSYTLYVTNTDGGVAIRVNAVNYSSTPSWTTTSPLSGAMKNTSISLQLVATSNSTVTYTLQAGSSLPSGLSLSSSGLITGTTPDIANDTTYNFTVVATDLENQDTPQAFQITINANDPYYELVTLHLPGTGTNLANNNTFLDASTNNFTITRSGNTTQGTFSPFSQTGWGNYFNGSSSLNAALATAMSTSNFTFECWLCDTGTISGDVHVIGYNVSGGGLLRVSGTDINWDIYAAGTPLRYSVTRSSNTWYHIAYSREGPNGRLFYNGNLVATQTDNTNYTATTNFIIGSNPTTSQFYPGYISNARVVIGRAVYTSSFNVPTSPLGITSGGQNPPQGTETKLLTCQSNRFLDSSSSPVAITIRYGSPSVQAFSPFNPTVSYNPAVHGGSVYFDGTGDYLSLPASTNLNIAQNQPFTLEYWIYMIGDYAQPFSSWNGQGSSSQYNVSGGSAIYLPGLGGGWGSTKIYWYNGQWGAWETGKTCTVDIGKYQWVHLAWTRDSSNVWRLYINGVSQTVGTYISTGASWSDNLAMNFGSLGYGIGGLSNNVPGQCYISGLKFVVGTALYTGASFTLPTAPPEVTTNTQVLTNFNNAGILDVTGKNVLETVGDAKISTAQSKFGGGSMLFDGTGDSLLAPNISRGLEMLTGDFTIECWIRFNVVGNGQIITGLAAANTIYWQYYTSQLAFGQNNVANIAATNWSPSSGVWYHVAVTRSGSTVRQFVDGTQLGSNVTSSVSFPNGPIQIGDGGAGGFNGYIQDLRITKGYARYTSNFTPPTQLHQTL